jgi:L-ornithine Nalpha-acyltransferase
LKDIIKKLCHPTVLVEDSHFLIKFAKSKAEIKAAQHLRYKVFHLEQGHGKDSIDPAGIDADKFDEFCLHLVVVEKADNKIVGTYRVHPGTIAEANLGLYTATEYELAGIDNIINEAVEVGRSCVCPQYRNGTVVALLWAGIAQIMVRGDFRYLLGCVSLETAEPAVGWALYHYFCQRGQVTETITAKPKANWMMGKTEQLEVDRLTAPSIRKYIPPLFRGYIRLGAKICGEPVFDQAFGTIDFLILLDLQLMPEKYFKHFKMR